MAMLLLLSMLVLLTQPPRSWGAEVKSLSKKPLIDDSTLVMYSPVEKGPPGHDGRDGRDGPRDEKENPGSPGATGQMGILDVPKEDNGSAGEPGPKGDSGPHGPPEPAGVRGLAGRDGPSRIQRNAEPRGKPTPKREPGPKGKVGAPGVQGSAGTRGPPGLKGEKGDPDISALWQQLEALQEQVRRLQGAFLLYKKVELFPHGRDVGKKVFKSAGFLKTFYEARQVCAQAGGQLPSPRSAAENHALQLLLDVENKGAAFLSMTDFKTKGRFTYPGGKPLVYTNWAPGEPNNDGGNEHCVEMYTNGKWNDKPCGANLLVICEF